MAKIELSFFKRLKSAGLLGLALAFLICGSLSNDTAGATDAHKGLGAMQALRAVFLLLAIVCTLPYVGRMKLSRLRVGVLLVLYVGLCLASTLWSDNALMTAGKSAELVTCAGIFLAGALGRNAGQRLRALRNILLLGLAAQVFVAFAGFCLRVPEFSQPRPGMLGTSTVNTPFLSGNGFGMAVALLIMGVYALRIEGSLTKRTSAVLSAILIGTIPFASSRTSLIVLGVAGAYILYRRSKAYFALAIALGCLGALYFAEPIAGFFLQDRSFDYLLTFSGRTTLWQAAADSWLQHFWFGAGFGVGTKEAVASLEGFANNISSAHNGFLEVATGVGMIGLIIFTLALGSAIVQSIRRWKRNPASRGNYVFIFPILAFTIMSLGAGGWLNNAGFFFFFLIAQLDYEAMEVRLYRLRLRHAEREVVSASLA